VQEYADPVIDWLEAERKIFKARYYRQHCTVENGAYIKDLSVIERDLGNVCILDNSPISYAWHEGRPPLDPPFTSLLLVSSFTTALMLSLDLANFLGPKLIPENAIPIEGWISDPTDNDLLHLIPFLRGLRFVGDVRNLLGLRSGARKI
jgi:CTD nuclear envelope phosphatase 1